MDDSIYDAVLSAMDDAEEMDGVEGKAYLDLMTAIAKEALSRRAVYARQMATDAAALAAEYEAEAESKASEIKMEGF